MSSLDFFHIITIHPPPCTPGSDTQGSAEAKPFWPRAVPGTQRKMLRNSFWSHPRLSPGICPGRGMGRGPCPTSPLCLIAKPVPLPQMAFFLLLQDVCASLERVTIESIVTGPASLALAGKALLGDSATNTPQPVGPTWSSVTSTPPVNTAMGQQGKPGAGGHHS